MATGLSVPTAHRFLKNLLDLGVARELVGQPGRYGLGHRLHRLVQAGAGDDRREAQGILQELADATALTAFLAVREGDEVVYVLRAVPQRSALVATTRIGHSAPLYCTGVGKALLAHDDEAAVLDYCRRIHFEPLTSRTPRDAADLLRRLATVRRSGVARDDEECEIGVACTAMAVPGTEAAISVSGAASSFSAPSIAMHTTALQRAAHRLVQLGLEAWL